MNKNTRLKYNIITSCYGREDIIEAGKNHGITWEEHFGHPHINWIRFSSALCRFIESGKSFELFPKNSQQIQEELSHWEALKEITKKNMTPYVKSAMKGITQNTGNGNMSTDPNALVSQSHESLNSTGGSDWCSEVETLSFINKKIQKLSSALSSAQQLKQLQE